MTWVCDPHTGGVKIPRPLQERIRRRILTYAEENYTGKYTRLEIRFRNQFCYVDAYTEPYVLDDWPDSMPESREEYIERLRNTPTHLCRLRHFAEDRWSLACYSYAHNTYEPCVLPTGQFECTPEEGFDVGAMFHLVD